MRQLTKTDYTNYYTGEPHLSDFGFQMACVVFASLAAISRAFVGFRYFLARPGAFLRHSLRKSSLDLTLHKRDGELSLVIRNCSEQAVWAEEATVNLIDLRARGETYPLVEGMLRICELIEPFEELEISLLNAVYDAAGRPQGVYFCQISAVVRYRVDGSDQEIYEASPPYHAAIAALLPITLRKAAWPKYPEAPRTKRAFPVKALGNRVRRGRRVSRQAAVVIEGRLGEGRQFSDSTNALVLSAYGCLVKLQQPVELGDSLLIRNSTTRQEQPCRVVYVKLDENGVREVGVGFETEAAEFWGTEVCLPSATTA